jgi:hypothetical protein
MFIDLSWSKIWQSAAEAIIFHLLFVVFLLGCIERAWHWFKAKPGEQKRRWTFGIVSIVGSIGIVIFVGQLLWALSSHVADEMAKSLIGHPKVTIEDSGFSGFIIGDLVATNAPFGTNTHVFVCGLKIYNSGTPTIIFNWHLIVRGPTETFEAKIMLPQPPATNFANNALAVFAVTESVVNKTWEDPIQRGAMKEGYVAFLIPETKLEFLAYPQTEYELRFRDIENNIVTKIFRAPAAKPPTR